MTSDRKEAVTELLRATEAAHGVFETTELNGVYDKEWPRWYAAYAVEHGIGQMVGHAVTVDQLGQFLETSFKEFENADPKPSDPWAAYIAGRIVAEL
jgi:hypothetical protein